MSDASLIILAAGCGTRLQPYTKDRPKCMVELHDRPLIQWHLATARAVGITDITLVGGYRADLLPTENVTVVHNEQFDSTNMVASLLCARDRFTHRVIVAYGDILYNTAVLKRLLDAPDEISVVIDRAWRAYWQQRCDDPLDDAESLRLATDGRILDIGQPPRSVEEIEGQYIGLMSFSGQGLSALLEFCDSAADAHANGKQIVPCPRPFPKWYMTDLLQALIARGVYVRSLAIDGGWLEVDNGRDLRLAERMTVRRNGLLEVAR